MKPRVFANLNLVVSKKVKSTNKQDGLLEGAYGLDDGRIARIELVIVDFDGKRTIIDVLDWESKLDKMVYFGKNE